MPDVETLKAAIAEVTKHAERGIVHIQQQMRLIEDLDRDGHNMTQAKEFLKILAEAQSLHVAYLERLVAELLLLRESVAG